MLKLVKIWSDMMVVYKIIFCKTAVDSCSLVQFPQTLLHIANLPHLLTTTGELY